MGNFIVIAVILGIMAGASYKLYKDKKNGIKCSGCPSCPSNGKCNAINTKK